MIAAATVALLGATVAGPAHAVPGDGKGEVVVKLVDPAGKPTAGVFYVLEEGATIPDSQIPITGMSTQVAGSLDAGRYGVMAMSPWGGMSCIGIDPCSFVALGGGGSGSAVTGAFDVADVETPVVATIKNPAPGRITGASAVGDRLTFTWSEGMQNLAMIYSGGGALYVPSVTWLRDGKVAGSGASYVVRPTDVGHRLSARLAYPATNLWSSVYDGGAVAPYTVAGPVAAKRSTRTTADLFRNKLPQGRGTGMVVDVTSAKQAVTDGKVTVRVGSWKKTQNVRNGSTRVALPKSLKPGRYAVTVSYLGSATYLASKAQKQTLTVTEK